MQTDSTQHTRNLIKIRDLILCREFAAGETISYEAAISKLEISENELEIVLASLSHQGYIRILAEGGFVVRDFTANDVRHSIEIRGLLEGMAARKAAEMNLPDFVLRPLHAIVEDVDQLLASNTPFDEIIGNFIHLNEDFHQLILKLASSPMVERSLEHVTSLPFSSPNDFVFVEGEAHEQILHLKLAQDHHRCIAQAIANNEGARAESLMREHARLAQRNFERTFKHSSTHVMTPSLSMVTAE